MQKHKNFHFGGGQVQFGMVNFALWDGTGRVWIIVPVVSPGPRRKSWLERFPSLVAGKHLDEIGRAHV